MEIELGGFGFSNLSEWFIVGILAGIGKHIDLATPQTFVEDSSVFLGIL